MWVGAIFPSYYAALSGFIKPKQLMVHLLWARRLLGASYPFYREDLCSGRAQETPPKSAPAPPPFGFADSGIFHLIPFDAICSEGFLMRLGKEGAKWYYIQTRFSHI